MTRMHTRHVLLAALVATVSARPAWAQDEAAEDEAADGTPTAPSQTGSRRLVGTPEVRVVAFQDRAPGESGDCDPAMARVGQCVELVDFLPTEQVLTSGRVDDRRLHQTLRNIGDVYADIFEDVAYRWNSSEIVSNNFSPYGVWRIPPASDHWEAIGEGAGEPLFGLPHSSYWVQQADFLPAVPPPTNEPVSSLYRYVRYNHEAGVMPPPDYAVLSGRFAERMVFDEEPRRLDMLDADPTSAAPFFDQMYPYSTARFFGAGDLGFGTEERAVTIPLSHFEVPPELRAPARLKQFLTPGVGTDPERMLTEAETRALEEQITRNRIRRSGYADLLFTDLESPEAARSIASAEYVAFYRDVGAQVVKFGRENYTPTHMRVMGSLFAMQSPPGGNYSFVRMEGGDSQVAELLLSSSVEEEAELPPERPPPQSSTSGDAYDEDVFFYYDDEMPTYVEESDSYDEYDLYDDESISGESSTHINYNALPPRLVKAHLRHLTEALGLKEMSDDYGQFLHDEFRSSADRRALLKDSARAMPMEPEETIAQWVTRYSVRYAKGANEAGVEDGMNRLALADIVTTIAQDNVAQADLMETALLLDHVRYSVVERFIPDAPPESWTSPIDLEAQATEQWVDVLGQHDYFPVPLDDDADGVRNVWYDPMSVCTQSRDFNVAAGERTFGAVNLDLVIVAADNQDLSDPYAALWEARDRVPFQWVDDPRTSATPPVMTRMVGLPDGQAVYRIRWRVWTGWHLLWGVAETGSVQWAGEVPEVAAEGQLLWMRNHYDWLREWAGTPVVAEDAHRVALRTAAICSDMALADPAVVPSLVRAALLDENFRPTTPYGDGDNSASVRGDDVGLAARLVGNRNVDERTFAEGAGQAGSSVVEENQLEAITGILPPRNPQRNIDDIRSWVLPKINQLTDDPLANPTMLAVFSTTHADGNVRTKQGSPRVPYFRRERPAGDFGHVVTAGWALAIAPNEVARPQMLSPDWVDTNSVNAENLNPKWRQRRTVHFTMAGDIGLRPVHYIRDFCVPAESSTDVASSTGPCAPGDAGTVNNDYILTGAVAHYTALQTLWLGSNRRFAVEYGIGFGGSLLTKSPSFYYSDPNDPRHKRFQNGIKFRFYGGPVVGIRGGNKPRRLYRPNGRGALWGAKDRDESSRRGRTEYGMRVGLDLGPSTTGLLAEVTTDLWWARSITHSRAKNRMFTAYHPSFLIGPFVRGRYARDVSIDTTGSPVRLGFFASAEVGLRIQARVFNYGGADPTAGLK